MEEKGEEGRTAEHDDPDSFIFLSDTISSSIPRTSYHERERGKGGRKGEADGQHRLQLHLH